MSEKKKKSAKKLWWKQHLPLLGLLVFSIALAVTIFACKKDFIELPGSGGNSNFNGDMGITSPGSSIATDLFKSVGESLLSDAATDGFGWVMSALGFSGSSGQTVEELGKINEQLIEINEKLNIMISELDKIEGEIESLICVTQTDNLIPYVTQIEDLYKHDYQTYLQMAINDTLAASKETLTAFANKVINGTSTLPGMSYVLTYFEQTLVMGESPIISRCLTPDLIPLPVNGTWADTAYYNQINSITNFYYAYYVQALLLYTEANNYLAWNAADSLGYIDSTFQSTNVNTICGIHNSDILIYCQQNIDLVNETYTNLIQFFTEGGAAYTDSVQITLMSTEVMNEFIWPRSIELYNKGTGANCPDPYIWDGSNATNKCGPLMSHYAAGLGSNHFNNTTGWYASTLDDLQHLVNVDSAKSFSSIGAYLEAHGFENMVGTQKIIQVREPVTVQIQYQSKPNEDLEVIPFLFVDWPIIKNKHGTYKAVFSEADDFTFLCKPVYTNNVSLGGGLYEQLYTYHYYSQDNHMPYPLGLSSYVPNSWLYCRAGAYPTLFYWTNAEWLKQDIQLPGWLKYRQDNVATGIYSYTTAYPFKLPVTRPSHITCTNGTDGKLRSSTNNGGMPTKCGADMDAWLAALVPKPPVQ